MDVFSSSKRSEVMRAVKAKNTKPEVRVRSVIHRMGYRFRLHRPDLPGKPDLTFPKFRAVLFVHGCFWHWHGCKRSRMPKSNVGYWRGKIERNIARDKKVRRELKRLGWSVLVIWECEVANIDKIERKAAKYLLTR